MGFGKCICACLCYQEKVEKTGKMEEEAEGVNGFSEDASASTSLQSHDVSLRSHFTMRVAR